MGDHIERFGEIQDGDVHLRLLVTIGHKIIYGISSCDFHRNSVCRSHAGEVIRCVGGLVYGYSMCSRVLQHTLVSEMCHQLLAS